MPITPPAVGNVVTPVNFLAVSAQGLVALSWDQSPLVTTYYVNRSLDNVAFDTIAQTASLTYNDTSGTVDTIYYYAVQAATTLASSAPTASLAALSLNPGETTVGNLILECQQRTDRVASDNITTQEWTSMIDKSFKELYDLLIAAYGDDYEVATPYSYTTAQNQTLYPLPPDFYKLLLCEVALNPSDPNSFVTLKQFMFRQKNLYNYPNQYTMYGITNLKYRLNGNNLMLVPIPQGNQTIRIWYAPRPNQLINQTDIVDCISGFEEYIVADVCIKALAKTEEDVSVFMAQKEALLKRVIEMTNNRNIGEPQTVTDSRRINFAWAEGDDGWGGGYGGMN